MHPYCTFDYVSALPRNDSAVRLLPPLNIHVQQIPIPGTALQDARGPYPRAPVAAGVSSDNLIQALQRLGIVSFVMVSDALDGRVSPPECFEFVRPYKEHAVVDLSSPACISRHHRREIRRAGRSCSVKAIELNDYLDGWCELYAVLIARHKLTGFHCFSRDYFRALGQLRAFIALGAFVKDRLVAAHIWVRYGARVYSHLACASPEGYRVGASYALHADALERFSDAQLIDLGAVPDGGIRSSSGLESFKWGFANDSSISWLCGTVSDSHGYELLCARSGTQGLETDYFPAYRHPGSRFHG